MKKLLMLFALILALASPALSSDVQISPTGPVYPLNGLGWGITGGTGFNNNFFFAPLSQNESVCVYVYNQNTSNPHTFTLGIFVTSNTGTTPSDGTWQAAANNANLTAPTAPSGSAGFGVNVSGVSLIAIEFSGSTVQSGSPDVANVRIVQTQGTCTSSQNFTYSVANTTASLTPFQSNSESLGQSFNGSGSITNPTAGLLIAGVNATAGVSRGSGYFDSITISTSVADTLTITWTSNTGTCTETSPLSTKASAGASGGVAASVFTFRTVCGTQPTASTTIAVISLPAGGVYKYDMQGFSIAPNNGNGIEVTSAAVTGTVSATIKWYEK